MGCFPFFKNWLVLSKSPLLVSKREIELMGRFLSKFSVAVGSSGKNVAICHVLIILISSVGCEGISNLIFTGKNLFPL